MPTYVAVDLGATSGRVVNVHLDNDAIVLEQVARFANTPISGSDGALTWDFEGLLSHVGDGLKMAADRSVLRSVAIDSWAVDYGLLDGEGRLIGPVHAYRSARTDGVMDAVRSELGDAAIYDITGIQFLAFNTIYQLSAAADTEEYHEAATMLMVPDLLNHELCGSTTNEITTASTTQLLDTRSHQWSDELMGRLGLRREIMPQLHRPGTLLGTVDGVGRRVDGLDVVAVASHDTASAIAGTPLRADRQGIYISCGTWSLVGCELTAPVTSAEALSANVTNELGVDDTTRLLKNVGGLWLLEESRRSWAAQGLPTEIIALVALAAEVPGGRSVIDVDDPIFASPGDMTARIIEACRASGQPIPETPGEITRVILDSLALAWRRTVTTIEHVTGTEAEVIHLVGGGSANVLLGQLCASACGRPVLAGPVEATVVGNALVQAIADGRLTDLAHGRELVERTIPPTRIEPQKMLNWEALGTRLSRTPLPGTKR